MDVQHFPPSTLYISVRHPAGTSPPGQLSEDREPNPAEQASEAGPGHAVGTAPAGEGWAGPRPGDQGARGDRPASHASEVDQWRRQTEVDEEAVWAQAWPATDARRRPQTGRPDCYRE